MIIDILQSVIEKFIDLYQEFFDFVFGDVNFAVLWRWLPSDIGAAATLLISVLFGIALINMIRRFLPF